MATGPAKLGWRWAVNNEIDDEGARDTPYLVDLYGRPSGQRAYDYDAIEANNGYDNLTDAYVAQKGEVLDIVIQNRAGESTGVAEAHPWHAHGNKYWDMGAGTDEFTYDKLHEYRASVKGQPFLRDTSVAYSGPGESYKEDKIPIFDHAGWRLFRIRVENPGAWLIHCHILPHAVMVSPNSYLLYYHKPLPPHLRKPFAFRFPNIEIWDLLHNNPHSYTPKLHPSDTQRSGLLQPTCPDPTNSRRECKLC